MKLLASDYSMELAEIIGIILGDGNIWTKKGYYYTTITGHSIDDYDYLTNHVYNLFKKVFGIKMLTRQHRTRNELFLYKGSKKLVNNLCYFGIKSRNKKKNNVSIPEWIFGKDEFIKSCIRGLIDTDGSFSPITGRNYPYIWFKSAIPSLRSSFDRAMKQLDYKTSRWSGKQTPQVFIGNKRDINRYIKEIGTNNKKHRIKIVPL